LPLCSNLSASFELFVIQICSNNEFKGDTFTVMDKS